MSQLFGKYRATVADNADPENRGRVRISNPGLLGKRVHPWAEACLPIPSGAGAELLPLPPIGSSVWVEFEAGDPAAPIWSGYVWDSAPIGIELVTAGKIRAAAGSMVELSAGQIKLEAGMTSASGVVKCSTLIADSVVASSYTPGAGNIW